MSTNIFQRLGAGIASWRLRTADVASEVNKAVTSIGLILLRYGIGQNALNFKRVFEFFGIKSESAANSDAMRIRNDAGNSENVAEQKICDLASDTGEFAKLLDVARQFSAVFIAKLYASRLDRRRFCAVKPTGSDYVFYIRKPGIGKIGKSWELFKKVFANYIDTRIGALGGKSAHNHQFPSLAASPIKGASGIGI